MHDPQYCSHCGAHLVAGTDRGQYGPRFKMLAPKWATIEGAAVYSGLSRRYLQQLGAEGAIRTVVVKLRPENTRGRRLVEIKSLDDWIESWACG